MSLGGIGFTTDFTGVHCAIQDAHAAGMIIVAVAGNFTQMVDVYPAAFREVISVTATNRRQKPWGNSAYVDHVTVAAPGEGVHVANVRPNDQGDYVRGCGPSNGTRCTAHHVAGIAAMWFEKHGGRQACMRKLGSGYAVQEQFLRDLTRKALNIDQDVRRYGKGLVNAAATLFPEVDSRL